MKDPWVTETIIQEASLAMELPASPASQFTTSSSNPEDQNPRSLSKESSDNLEQSKHKEGCDPQRKPDSNAMAPPMVPPNQTQPMDISDNVDCIEDEEQIVPQSISSCKVPRPNSSDMTFVEEQTETVSSQIMKMGLKDLLDHDGINKSDKSESNDEFTTYQQKKKMAASWLGSSQNHHTIFGPLSRPSTVHSDNYNSVPRSQVKEREGSPVITHKKFDYQKKLTLHGTSTASSPLNLSKRSPSPNFKPETTDATPADSSPIDLTIGKKQTPNVQCPSFQDPVYKSEHSTKPIPDFGLNRGYRSHFLLGVKPEIDPYIAPRMPSFWLPRSSSCSPGSASDHSTSSTTSSTEQKSEPESSDIKPSPEMLSHLRIDVNTAPPQLSRIDHDVPSLPRVVPFDPSRFNNFYIQQLAAANLKGGFYPLPLTHFGGYATANVSPPQPTSPSSKNRNQKQDKMFICQECGAVFKHRHHVVRHMRSHSGERPFRCEECGATFARKCILTNHKRTHTGEKPYICSECGDSFSRKHHLVIHRRTHTGEKPYKCLHCGAAFARSHHLNRHRKTHVKVDVQQQGEINRMYFAQMPTSLPLQGLPTMVPLLPPTLLPTCTAMPSTQELSKQNRGDSTDTKEDGFEQGTCQINSEVEKSTSDHIGANTPDHSECQAK